MKGNHRRLYSLNGFVTNIKAVPANASTAKVSKDVKRVMSVKIKGCGKRKDQAAMK